MKKKKLYANLFLLISSQENTVGRQYSFISDKIIALTYPILKKQGKAWCQEQIIKISKSGKITSLRILLLKYEYFGSLNF